MTPMTTPRYLAGFQQLMDRVEATDRDGNALAIGDGLARAIGLIENIRRDGLKLFFVGNGGSAAIASHLAVDFWKNGKMRALALNDPSFLTCVSNDYGYPSVFEKPLETYCDPGDGLIAISSSGASDNILRAAGLARRRGLRIITLSGFSPENPLRALGDVNLYVPSSVYNYVESLHQLLGACLVDCMAPALRPAHPKEALLA